MEAKQKKTYSQNIKDFGLSILVTVASVMLPPISIISLIYGGTIHEIIENRKRDKKDFKDMLERPIATLSRWKE
jgi:hypothetical protein